MPAPSPAPIVRPGQYVGLTYCLADEAGNLVEQTALPVGYIHGGRTELIGGLDAAVSGRCVGDQVELLLAPQDGFGLRDPDLTFTDAIENVPIQFRFVGAQVPMQNQAGEVRTFYVTRIGETTLSLDGNHPLAGKTLKVRVVIQEVRDPTPDELLEDGGAGAPAGVGLH